MMVLIDIFQLLEGRSALKSGMILTASEASETSNVRENEFGFFPVFQSQVSVILVNQLLPSNNPIPRAEKSENKLQI